MSLRATLAKAAHLLPIWVTPMADYWLVLIGDTARIAADEDFVEWADQVKYDGVEYEAIPLYRPAPSITTEHGNGQ